MKSTEIRKRFLEFFKKRGHTVIPSASLVPVGDPSVLFTTAGMHPLVPYLLGEKHPSGQRLVNVQKCVRTQDIDEVGDNTHDTFFEMLGNWSLGDYFKKEAISWSYEFLTSKKEGLGLEPKRLYVTVFEGDQNAGKDTKSAEIWQSLGIPAGRIYFMNAKSNWWQAGESGPCGPDTEMFYDITEAGLGDLDKAGFIKADEEQKVVEIWNDVFMEYLKKDGKVVGKLPRHNVDTGAGLERLCMVMQNTDNIFGTDLFTPIIEKINQVARFGNERAKRIVADHIRTAVFMIADGVTPANTHRGYVLRRIIRRAVKFGRDLGLAENDYQGVIEAISEKYGEVYSNILQNVGMTQKIFAEEVKKFSVTLEKGLKEFERGEDPFVLFTSYGFPIELTLELAREKGRKVDLIDFEKKMAGHKDLSRTASVGMFKGGLANQSGETIRLHTAHHLLLSALQEVLGKEVKQRGSNITEERLRIDFSFPRKMTEEEKKNVEGVVNKRIGEQLEVIRREMPRAEAERIGAEMEFGAKYPETVSVYFIEDARGRAVSKEFCGGPHVKNTKELGHFKILKEEAVSAGVRRIKAVFV